MDAPLPVMPNKPDSLLPQPPDGGGLPSWDVVPGSNKHSYQAAPVFPTIAFLGMALVLVFIVNHVYKAKNKPRRKKPRLRKLQFLNYGKMPGV